MIHYLFLLQIEEILLKNPEGVYEIQVIGGKKA
jgi:hypothetical protein